MKTLFKLLPAVLILPSLTSCGVLMEAVDARWEKYEALVERKIGSVDSESEIVNRFGRPDDNYDFANGTRRLNYRNTHTYEHPLAESGYKTLECTIEFLVDGSGKIITSAWQGIPELCMGDF